MVLGLSNLHQKSIAIKLIDFIDLKLASKIKPIFGFNKSNEADVKFFTLIPIYFILVKN